MGDDMIPPEDERETRQADVRSSEDSGASNFDTTVDDDPHKIVFARTVELFDIGKEREKKRGLIALVLVFVLVGVVLITFELFCLAITAHMILGRTVVSVAEIRELLSVLLPPIVALVGSVVGFYFGGKN
jgi:hypothetical protein